MANLNHVHLRVRDLAKARAFYAAWFGLRDHVMHGRILFMRDGAGLDLALAPAETLDPFPDWFHIGFRLESGDDVAALHDRMASAGVPIRAPLERQDDFVFFRCADPDGTQIEVYWEPQPG